MEQIQNISLEKIFPNENNFYSLTDLEILADDIERQGLQHNLVVTPIENSGENHDSYRIVSGHRRFEAIKLLRENGRFNEDTLPCIVKIYDSPENEKLDLVMLNATSRKITDSEMLQQYEIAINAVTMLKKEGNKITGKTREYIANLLGVSPAQVAKIERIEKSGNDELKNAINNGDISIFSANEIAKLPDNEQIETVEKIKAEKSDNKGKKYKKSASKNDVSDSQKSFKTFVSEWLNKVLKSDNFDEISDVLREELENMIGVR